VFSTYEKARKFCERYEKWDPEFCDPHDDSWGTEQFMVDIEEHTVE